MSRTSTNSNLPGLSILVLDSTKLEALWLQYLKFVDRFLDVKFRNKDGFLRFLSQENNLFYEVGELQGIIGILNVIPGLDGRLHVVMFDKVLKGREELLRAAMQNAIQVAGLERISAHIPPSWDVTRKFVERVGFTREGRLRNAWRSAEGVEDVYIYGILAQEVTDGTGTGFATKMVSSQPTH